MRFEDSPNLFGCGSGVSTIADMRCELCKAIYNKGALDDDGDVVDKGQPSVCWVYFAGLYICGCCFERIESAVLHRMSDILPWYERILKHKREMLEEEEKALIAVQEEVQP